MILPNTFSHLNQLQAKVLITSRIKPVNCKLNFVFEGGLNPRLLERRATVYTTEHI